MDYRKPDTCTSGKEQVAPSKTFSATQNAGNSLNS